MTHTETKRLQHERNENQASACTHLNQIRKAPSAAELETLYTGGCPDCLAVGDTWVHLRLCLECGHVGCCDSSKNKHATAHYHSTQHPIMRSIEPGEDWGWCYTDQADLDFTPEAE